ncbi:MAG: RDD family protein [Chitinophagales bacterium]|nr:RDD family protein [Chitinophagales bacterium]
MNSYYHGSEEQQYVIYAGFWARFFAYFIDGLILAIPGFIIRFVVNDSLLEGNLLSATITFIVDWLYFALQESGSAQATLGKRILDIKVTDMDGGRISFGRATGRYFGKIISAIILMIGFIMAAFDDRKQALHDKMAGTLVVSSSSF